MTKRAFTQIEIIVLVGILTITAAFLMPHVYYLKLFVTSSERRLIQGTITNVRTSLNLWRAEQMIDHSLLSWPSFDEFCALFPPSEFPDNPWKDAPNDAVSDASNFTPGTVSNQDPSGWAYHFITGKFWPNSSKLGENAW